MQQPDVEYSPWSPPGDARVFGQHVKVGLVGVDPVTLPAGHFAQNADPAQKLNGLARGWGTGADKTGCRRQRDHRVIGEAIEQAHRGSARVPIGAQMPQRLYRRSRVGELYGGECDTTRCTLDAGDYSIAGLESHCAIEREMGVSHPICF